MLWLLGTQQMRHSQYVGVLRTGVSQACKLLTAAETCIMSRNAPLRPPQHLLNLESGRWAHATG